MASSTPAQFRRAAEKACRAANPDAKGLSFAWVHTSPICSYRDGSGGKFRCGQFWAQAPGFANRLMDASMDLASGRMMVR